MMRGKIFWQMLADMAVVGLAWYLAEPRPDMVPAFWHRVEQTSARVSRYANGRYRESIKELL